MNKNDLLVFVTDLKTSAEIHVNSNDDIEATKDLLFAAIENGVQIKLRVNNSVDYQVFKDMLKNVSAEIGELKLVTIHLVE